MIPSKEELNNHINHLTHDDAFKFMRHIINGDKVYVLDKKGNVVDVIKCNLYTSSNG